MKNQPFTTSLKAENNYKLGEPILITFDITNNDNETYQLLKWGTPLEKHFTVDCFKVQRDGVLVPYDGKFVKRGDPSSDNYIIIQPGQQFSETFDISETYAIDQVGNYTVTLNAAFFDAFAIQLNEKQAPRKLRDHQSHKLPIGTVQFKVTEGAEPEAHGWPSRSESIQAGKG